MFMIHWSPFPVTFIMVLYLLFTIDLSSSMQVECRHYFNNATPTYVIKGSHAYCVYYIIAIPFTMRFYQNSADAYQTDPGNWQSLQFDQQMIAYWTQYVCLPLTLQQSSITDVKCGMNFFAVGYIRIHSTTTEIVVHDYFYCCCIDCSTLTQNGTKQQLQYELMRRQIESQPSSAIQLSEDEYRFETSDVNGEGYTVRMEECYDQMHRRTLAEHNRNVCMVRIELIDDYDDNYDIVYDVHITAGRLDIHKIRRSDAVSDLSEEMEVFLYTNKGFCQNYFNNSIDPNRLKYRIEGLNESQCSVIVSRLNYKLTCCCYLQLANCHRPFDDTNVGDQCAFANYTYSSAPERYAMRYDTSIPIDQVLEHKSNRCRVDMRIDLNANGSWLATANYYGTDDCGSIYSNRLLKSNEMRCTTPYALCLFRADIKHRKSFELNCCCFGLLCNWKLNRRWNFNIYMAKQKQSSQIICASDLVRFPFGENAAALRVDDAALCVKAKEPSSHKELYLFPDENFDFVNETDRAIWFPNTTDSIKLLCRLVEIFAKKLADCTSSYDHDYPWMVFICRCTSYSGAMPCDANNWTDIEKKHDQIIYPKCMISFGSTSDLYGTTREWKSINHNESKSSFWCYDQMVTKLDHDKVISTSVTSSIMDWNYRQLIRSFIDEGLSCNRKTDKNYDCLSMRNNNAMEIVTLCCCRSDINDRVCNGNRKIQFEHVAFYLANKRQPFIYTCPMSIDKIVHCMQPGCYQIWHRLMGKISWTGGCIADWDMAASADDSATIHVGHQLLCNQSWLNTKRQVDRIVQHCFVVAINRRVDCCCYRTNEHICIIDMDMMTTAMKGNG